MHATHRVECREILNNGGVVPRRGANYGEVAVVDVRQSNKSGRTTALDRNTCEAPRLRKSQTQRVTRRNGYDHGQHAPDPDRYSLARTIEGEIVPRLLMLHRNDEALLRRRDPVVDPRLPTAEEVADFAHLAMNHEVSVASAYVAAVRDRGVSLESVCLELLAPAARRLGELWEADLCDFTQVTIGLWRLRQVLHALNPSLDREGPAPDGARRILLAAAPGDQHTFGLIMVAEFFRRSGWYVCDNIEPSTQELAAALRRDIFDVVGLSVGCESRLDQLRETITALRRASRNSGLLVMVGGSPFIHHPELALSVGADATAADAKLAPVQATALLSQPVKRL